VQSHLKQPQTRLRAALGVLALGLLVAATACHTKTRKITKAEDDGSHPAHDYEGEDPEEVSSIDPLGIPGNESKASKLIFLVSTNDHLYSFDPAEPGQSAYHLIGHLDCKNHGGRPQSMGVDRKGIAWVFYDSRELFRVDTRNAHCEPTTYHHPVPTGQLGMSFTSTAPGSPDEKLFMMSPTYGLATIDMPGLGTTKMGARTTMAELTGGGDGRLFTFESQGGILSELSRTDWSAHHLHTFSSIGFFSAWAFARFAGKFYLFTSYDAYTPSKTTIWDPIRNTESVRDTNVGFVVVGAGQSTLVPPTDKGGTVSEEFPPQPIPKQDPGRM
jgi:hypothetical protein